MKLANKFPRLSAKNTAVRLGAGLAAAFGMAMNTFAADADLSGAAKPVVELIQSFMPILIAIVVAVGGLYCVILGVKFAKAEEPQDREKAKSHLKNAIIGFVLIFVLVLALDLLTPILTKWVTDNGGNMG